ncbi:MAG: right-handed parallel beta-helix repeat-containing protein [Verrucomicrobia bacterium]|nr:right-handed parallel beta-helix repeat-containing protein [Verrucomicrobiota bacterium]
MKVNFHRLQCTAILVFAAIRCFGIPTEGAGNDSQNAGVRGFGAKGDGKSDDTTAIQKAVDAGAGEIRFLRGVYRITRPIVIDLDRVGPTSIGADGPARILMNGPGPALRFVGTHEGTAGPGTFKDSVWERQRSPMVDGLEIEGAHPEACGIEASGTMQLTVTRVVIRKALHGIHLVNRNRNVIISNCHIYENRGVGVFYDRVNLHQSNITGSHISYNKAGGIVIRGGDVRNVHVGSCDIEGNMGGSDSEPTANVLLDSTGGSIGEIAIVGCTIQHEHTAPNSANIRVNGGSAAVQFTPETRHGNITIADNVLSDVQMNIDLQNTRGVTVTGNTIWKGYTHNLRVANCSSIVVANNVFDRNPRYHYGDGSSAKLGLVFSDSDGCTMSGNHVQGVGDIPAAVEVQRCRRFNITDFTILDFGKCGLLLDGVSNSRVSDCLIRDDSSGNADSQSIRVTGGGGNMIVNNLFGNHVAIDGKSAYAQGNYGMPE